MSCRLRDIFMSLVPLWYIAVSFDAGVAQELSRSSELVLHISSKGFPSEEKVGSKTIRFSEVCRVIGARLTKNQGLWGTGPFQSFVCKDSQNESSPSDSDLKWELSIYSSQKEKGFIITLTGEDGKKIPVANYKLMSSKSIYQLFAKRNFLPLTAFYLSSALPFRSAVPNTDETPLNGMMVGGPVGVLKNLSPPKELIVFETKFMAGVWRSNPIGVAKIQGPSGDKQFWKIEGVGAKPSSPFVFLQQIEEREEIVAKGNSLIQDELGGLLDGILGLARSVYLGARYGIPIGGSGVMKNANLLGVFAEFRSGIASGVKLNYDLVQEKSYSDDITDEDFGWSRLQIGYSLIKNVSWVVINQIDATPRIGLTSLKYSLTPVDDPSSKLEFILSRAPTIGLEIGIERTTPFVRLRGWGFGSFSVGILPIDKNHTTTSFRFGLDAYRDLFKLGNKKFVLLGFTSYEATRIVKTATTEDAADLKLTLTNAYVGAGATLSW